MAVPRFLQVHTLHSYPAALLNRDDSGLAKRLTFGGSVRTRISSQCLKRHWRTADDEFALSAIDGAADAIRSRNVVDRRVIQPLRGGAFSDELLDAVQTEFNQAVYGGSGATESGRQPLLLGLPEVEYLEAKARAICEEHSGDAKAAGEAAKLLFQAARRNEERDNFAAFRQQATLPGGLVGALFGRMVTSDPGANIEAAVHVSHAFTVHAEESESDYFSVVDDLQEPGRGRGRRPHRRHGADRRPVLRLRGGGRARAGVQPGGLRRRDWQAADRGLAAKVVEHLVHLIATVSPGAKLGSTAPYAAADLMLIEAGNRQPRSLANAFRKAVPAQTDAAAQAIAGYLGKLDDCYGAKEARRVMSVEPCEVPGASWLSCDDVAAWAADAIRAGEVA